MKKTLLISSCCCVLPIFFSSFAYSADGPYLSANVGVTLLSNSDVSDSALPGVTTVLSQDTEEETTVLSYDAGMKFGAAIGYRYGNGRIEGELSYQRNDLDETSYFGFGFDSTGDVEGTAFLLNGYYDFSNTTAFTPYLSAGLGYAKVELNDYNISGSGLPNFSGDDSVFAYQVGLGVGYAVTDKVTLDAKYRYFATEDIELGISELEIASNDFIVGVRYNF